jgi:festuclavine dehydrogenase
VAELLTEILGRTITHRRLSADEYKEMFLGQGLEPEYADDLVTVELEASRGLEVDIFNVDEDKKFVGKHTLREYLKTNRDIWVK